MAPVNRHLCGGSYLVIQFHADRRRCRGRGLLGRPVLAHQKPRGGDHLPFHLELHDICRLSNGLTPMAF